MAVTTAPRSRDRGMDVAGLPPLLTDLELTHVMIALLWNEPIVAVIGRL